LTCVLISESGRLPGGPLSVSTAAINSLLSVIGLLLTIPAAVRLFSLRQFAGVGLALLGTPLITLLTAGLIYSVFAGEVPSGPLVGLGLGGLALTVFALREFGRSPGQVTRV